MTDITVTPASQLPQGSSLQSNLAYFFASLPWRLYCSNDKTASLTLLKPQAMQFAYIQANSAWSLLWLCFDLDHPSASTIWEDVNGPAPNLIVINPANGHAHYMYRLQRSVCTSKNGHPRPKLYASAIRDGLSALLDADPGYAGLMVKTPGHKSHITISPRSESFTLDELREYVSFDVGREWRRKSLQKGRSADGVGRNKALFDLLRVWSYEHHEDFESHREFEVALLAQAERLNCFPDNPKGDSLAPSEVGCIVRSISKYIQAGTGRKQADLQAWRGRQNGRKRRDLLLPQVMRLYESGESARAIARQLEVSHSTVSRWIHACVSKPQMKG